MSPAGARPLGLTLAVLVVLVALLHFPVLTQNLLITPAGMHHAMWPWKAYLPEAVERGAVLEENHSLSDLLFMFYPWQVHTLRSFSQGVIPLWNPHSYSGVPLAANAQSAVFYPLHWPALAFPSMHVFTLAAIAKILLAGLFMAVFLRGLGCGSFACALGAMAFALGDFMTSWLGYSITNVAILLPLLMHSARRLALKPGVDGFLLLTFAGAAQYLGGHPQTSLHLVGVAALYHLWCVRRASRPRLSMGLFAGGSLLGFTLASIQLLPFIQYLLNSAALLRRQAGPSVDQILPPRSLMTYLIPDLFGRPESFTYTGQAPFQETVGYVGAGVLLLALLSLGLGPSARFFQILVACCALVVHGPAAVHELLRMVPVLGISGTGRLRLMVTFGLATLAALALEKVASGRSSTGRPFGSPAGWLAALAIVLGGLALAFPAGGGTGWISAGIIAGTALMIAMAIHRPAMKVAYLSGVLLLAGLDLAGFAYGFNPHASPGELFRTTPLIEFLKRDAAADPARGGRMMTTGWSLRPETHVIYQLDSVEGFDVLEPVRYRELLDRARVPGIHETGAIPDGSRRLLNMMGLRYLVTPPGGALPGAAMTLAYDGPDGRVFINEQAAPRLAFVDTARFMKDGALGLLASGEADPSEVALIDGEPRDGGSPPAAASPGAPAPAIQLQRSTSRSLTISVRGHGRPGWLVVTDAYFPGWEAKVNGSPVPVRRANHVFRAVRLPAGDAIVDLSYRPIPFRAALWVSGISLLTTVALGIRLSRGSDGSRG